MVRDGQSTAKHPGKVKFPSKMPNGAFLRFLAVLGSLLPRRLPFARRIVNSDLPCLRDVYLNGVRVFRGLDQKSNPSICFVGEASGDFC